MILGRDAQSSVTPEIDVASPKIVFIFNLKERKAMKHMVVELIILIN